MCPYFKTTKISRLRYRQWNKLSFLKMASKLNQTLTRCFNCDFTSDPTHKTRYESQPPRDTGQSEGSVRYIVRQDTGSTQRRLRRYKIKMQALILVWHSSKRDTRRKKMIFLNKIFEAKYFYPKNYEFYNKTFF